MTCTAYCDNIRRSHRKSMRDRRVNAFTMQTLETEGVPTHSRALLSDQESSAKLALIP